MFNAPRVFMLMNTRPFPPELRPSFSISLLAEFRERPAFKGRASVMGIRQQTIRRRVGKQLRDLKLVAIWTVGLESWLVFRAVATGKQRSYFYRARKEMVAYEIFVHLFIYWYTGTQN